MATTRAKVGKYETWYEVAHNTGARLDPTRGLGREWPAKVLVRFRSERRASQFAGVAMSDGAPARVRSMQVATNLSRGWDDACIVPVAGADPYSTAQMVSDLTAKVQS